MIPKSLPAETCANLGEANARIGELVARRLFAGRGNPSEVHLSEVEIAMLAATAAYLRQMTP